MLFIIRNRINLNSLIMKTITFILFVGILVFYSCSEHRVAKLYYKDGKLKEELPYKDDKESGEQKEYYESGNLNIITPFSDGKENGMQKWYFESGKLKAEGSEEH